MGRKILHNYNKSQRKSGDKRGKIGLQLPIMDKNGTYLSVGDMIQYGKYYEGRLLFNPSYNQYGVAIRWSMWYGDDEYNIDSYGKFVDIPMDNGARMEIEKIA